MKGFIEVTKINNEKCSIRLDTITYFENFSIIQDYEVQIKTKESYEQIKELIKQAQ